MKKSLAMIAFLVSSSVLADEVCKDWSAKQGDGVKSVLLQGEACLGIGGITGNTTLWARAEASATARLLNQNMKVVEAKALAKLPEYENPSVEARVFALGNQIYAIEKQMDKAFFSYDIALPPFEKGIEHMVMVGPIPVTLEAKFAAQGKVALVGETQFRSIVLKAVPQIESQVFVAAAPGVPGMNAKISGHIALVDSSLPQNVSASLSFMDAEIQKPVLVGKVVSSHETTALNGKVLVAVESPMGSFEHELYSFPGYTFGGVLAEKQFEIPLFKVQP